MLLVLLGLISSVLTSLVKWINDKLSNTALQGDGALLVSVIMALTGSVAFHLYMGTLVLYPPQLLIITFGTVFATADLYYRVIVEKLFPFLKEKIVG